MIRPHVACGVAVLAASLVLATPRPAFASSATGASAFGPSEDATSLVVQADAAHEAGRLVEAADLYTRAYRAMSAEEREALGAVVVGVALEDLKATYTTTSDAAYARTAGELLDAFESDVGGALPDDVAAHRSWIDDALAGAEPEDEPEVDDPTDASITPEPTPGDRGERDRSGREIAGPVLVAVGAAAAIGGVVMLALGAPLGDDAEASRDAALADPRFTSASPSDQMIFQMQYEDYVDAEKKRGTGLVAGGAVLLVIGVGLATYGVVRLVKHRRAASTAARVSPIAGGFRF